MSHSQSTATQDSLFVTSLSDYQDKLQQGALTVTESIEQCLQHARALQPRLKAFEYLAEAQALQHAEQQDKARQRGEASGALAGIPIGIKDIITVEGMPTSNGSLHSQAHLNGPQGSIMRRLLAAGCIVLGKTKTVEYALGATGINSARGTPVNPWDSLVERIPGGSSSGSAVAVAAGMCGFALGSDTGGSIRNPASLNGLVGHKTTVGLWPTDGVFPLSSTLDSLGPLCRCVADAALIHTVVTGQKIPPAPTLHTLKLGSPQGYFLEDLDAPVAAAYDATLDALSQAGVTLVPFDIPQARERDKIFPDIVAAELIAKLGAKNFKETRADMDPVTASRAAHGLDVLAIDYLRAKQRHDELSAIAKDKMQGLNGWLSPTNPFTPMGIESAANGSLRQRALQASRNTMPVNLFGLCALTLPIHQQSDFGTTALPVGLQLIAGAHEDAQLLSMALSIEATLKPTIQPDLTGFFN